MDEQDVRERAEALCAAAVAGDIDRVIEDFSQELRHNLGEVLALLPLPSESATVDRIERGGGSGYTVVLRLAGEREEVQVQTRWKDRDGRITLIEASHLSRTEKAAPDLDGEAGADGPGGLTA
jgi:ABC-type ATPase with predicted acetyltransferase domain